MRWWFYRQDQLRIPAFLCRRKFVGAVGVDYIPVEPREAVAEVSRIGNV